MFTPPVRTLSLLRWKVSPLNKENLLLCPLMIDEFYTHNNDWWITHKSFFLWLVRQLLKPGIIKIAQCVFHFHFECKAQNLKSRDCVTPVQFSPNASLFLIFVSKLFRYSLSFQTLCQKLFFQRIHRRYGYIRLSAYLLSKSAKKLVLVNYLCNLFFMLRQRSF